MRALISQDREAFYSAEIDARERQGYPPFGRLAALVISGGDKHSTEAYAKQLAAAAPFTEEVRVLGPAEAPLAVSHYLRQWLANAPKPKGKLALEVDVDPQSFL